MNPDKSPHAKEKAAKDFRRFLSDRTRKSLKSKDSDSDDSDDEEEPTSLKQLRRQEKERKERFIDRQIDRQTGAQMIQDPEKKISELLDTFNNITNETAQLIEIKDIIDELKMIYEVYDEQYKVIDSFFKALGKLDDTDIYWDDIPLFKYQRAEIITLSKKAEETLAAVRHA